MYHLNSDKEINGDFRMADNGDNSETDDKEHILREKRQPIKNNKTNKPPSLTLKEIPLKATHTKKTNKEHKDETQKNMKE